VSDREGPLVTGVNGTLMARRTAVRPALIVAPWSSPVLLDSRHPSGRGRRVKARGATEPRPDHLRRVTGSFGSERTLLAGRAATENRKSRGYRLPA
jgi:hypothetical protein